MVCTVRSGGATIRFTESQPIAIDARRLPEFATEQQNTGNRRHVTRIELGLPAAALEEGVTFVYAPDLG